jgi:hypothetical protein
VQAIVVIFNAQVRKKVLKNDALFVLKDRVVKNLVVDNFCLLVLRQVIEMFNHMEKQPWGV